MMLDKSFLKFHLNTTIKDQKDEYYSFKETIFFPNKGGMLEDKGTINNLEVLDLKIIDEEIYHKVDGMLKDPIKMEINKENRIINATCQSAMHLLDGYYRKKGITLTAIGVNHLNMWFEINEKNVKWEDLEEVENYINRIIFEDIETTYEYIDGKKWEDEKYHKFKELRIVNFGKYDRQPCGTIHIDKTSQIGNFIILDFEKTSRGTRIFYTCSLNTNKQYKKDYNLIKEIIKKTNSNKDNILEKIDTLLNNLNNLTKENENLKNKILEEEVKKIKDVSDYSVIFLENQSSKQLSSLGSLFHNKYQKNVILISNQENTSFITVASFDGKAKEIFEKIKNIFEVKGGGSPKMASGSCFVDCKDLKIAIENILKDYK